MMTLIEQCLSLSYKERLHLYEALQDSLAQGCDKEDRKPRSQSRGKMLLDIMGHIIGETISIKSRMPRFVWARTMVAYQLISEGYSSEDAGRAIGKHHSTILYLNDNMNNALAHPALYRDVVDIWNQFQNYLQNETYRGTDQDSL